MIRWPAMLTAMLLPFGCARDVRDSEVVRIGDAVQCARCTVQMNPLHTLSLPDTADDGLPLAVRRDARGRYWVFRSGGLPAVFSSDGSFVRLVGRTGMGPGEYVGATDMLTVADSIVVLDGRARRATVLTDDLRVVRTIVLPLGVRGAVAAAWPDTVFVNGVVPQGDVTGAIHRVSFAGSTGEIQRSFLSGLDSAAGPALALRSHHHMALDDAGELWTAWASLYEARLWDSDGRLRKVVERRPSWFADTVPVSYDWRTEPPPPVVGGLHVDSNGWLWVFLRVARPTWPEAWAHAPADAGEAAPVHELLYSTTIEVIDPSSHGRVLARASIDAYFIDMVPGVGAAMLELDERGNRRISFTDLQLVGAVPTTADR